MSRAIVIGSGHNGLVCALKLAQAGREVVVVERMDTAGGLAAPLQIAEGYTLPGLLHETGNLRRGNLAGLGLSFTDEPQPLFAPHREHKGAVILADAERCRAELEAAAPGDGEAYVEWRAFLGRVGPFVRGVLDKPPPPLSPASLSDLWGFGKTGLALRRLGQRDMTEVMRVAPMCVADWVQERFGSPLLAAALAAPAVLGSYLGPWSAGTAANLLLHECTRGPALKGGPAALVAALVKALEGAGGTVWTGSAVRRIVVEKGRTSGVELERGEVLTADVVACACDPKTALLELVEPLHLPLTVEEQLRVVRTRGTAAKLHLALDGPLQWRHRPGERFSRALVAEHVDDIERAFDAVKYRQAAARPHLDVWVPTVDDPTLAPEGHEVVSLLVSYAPMELEGGWTEAARERLLQGALAVLEEVAPGVRDRVVAHELLAPPDLAERYGLTGGHLFHGEPALDQLYFMRPVPALARYATPIGGLYLCGSGSHPGGGLTGQPGALAAAAILSSPTTG